MPADFFNEFIVIIIAAFIGGFIARSLKLPSIIGYIGSGIVFGAVGKDFIHSYHSLEALSQIGVSLLLFTLGFEISPETFKKIHKKVFVAGVLQVVLTAVVCYPVFLLFSFPQPVALLFSLVCSFSSTVVIVKSLEEKGRLTTFPGTHVFTYLLIQDLFVIPIIFVLPLLFSPQAMSSTDITSFILSFGKTIAIFGVLWIVSRLFLSRVLTLVFKYQSHELPILASIFIAAVSIWILRSVGLPDSLAAFMAGILISEEGKNLIPMAEIRPFRDILLVLFFVVNGMLLDSTFVLDNMFMILLLTAVVLILKYITSFVLLLLSSYIPSASVFISSHLTNIGEFAVIVGQVAFFQKLITADQFNLLLAIFISSLVLIPVVTRFSGILEKKVEKHPVFKKMAAKHQGHAINQSWSNALSNHTIIAGYGALGKELEHLLSLANISTIIIDFDKKAFARLSPNHPVIYGDSTDSQILESAHIRTAKALVVTLRDEHSIKKLVKHAKEINPHLVIFALVKKREEKHKLIEIGVNSVVHPDREAALQIGDTVLSLYGVMSVERNSLISYLRADEVV